VGLPGDRDVLAADPVEHEDGEAFSFAELESEVLDVEGVRIRVATPRMLYRMKRDTVRGKDRLDAEMLEERFALEDE
jgi:hypothetical protein